MSDQSSPFANARSVDLLGVAVHSIMIKRVGRPDLPEYREGVDCFRILKSVMNFVLKMLSTGQLSQVAEDDIALPVDALAGHLGNVFVTYGCDEQLMSSVLSEFRSDIRIYFGYGVMVRPRGGPVLLPDVSSEAGLRGYLAALTDELTMQSYWSARLLPRPRLAPYMFTVMLDSISDVLHIPDDARQPVKGIIVRNLQFEHAVPNDDQGFPAAFLSDNYRPGF